MLSGNYSQFEAIDMVETMPVTHPVMFLSDALLLKPVSFSHIWFHTLFGATGSDILFPFWHAHVSVMTLEVMPSVTYFLCFLVASNVLPVTSQGCGRLAWHLCAWAHRQWPDLYLPICTPTYLSTHQIAEMKEAVPWFHFMLTLFVMISSTFAWYT